jgi:hypothetical protein
LLILSSKVATSSNLEIDQINTDANLLIVDAPLLDFSDIYDKELSGIHQAKEIALSFSGT